MRAIKCKVFIHSISPFSKVYSPGIYGKLGAMQWINSVGWGHVSAGLCEHGKCMKAKKYIDCKQLVPGKNNKAMISLVEKE